MTQFQREILAGFSWTCTVILLVLMFLWDFGVLEIVIR